jgi:hypothetical protein
LTFWGFVTCLIACAAGLSLGYISWLEFAGWYFAENGALPVFLIIVGVYSIAVSRLVVLRWGFAARLLLLGASLGALGVHLITVFRIGSPDLSRMGFADVFVMEAFYLCAAVLLGGLGYIIGRVVNQLWRI